MPGSIVEDFNNTNVAGYAQLQSLLLGGAAVAILSAIRELLHPPVPKRRAIGFTADLDEKS